MRTPHSPIRAGSDALAHAPRTLALLARRRLLVRTSSARLRRLRRGEGARHALTLMAIADVGWPAGVHGRGGRALLTHNG